jgi:ribosomal protein S18 acetylase RimI-like enzyme
MPTTHIRVLLPHEITRVREIDRSERMRVGYRVQDGRLIRQDGDWSSVPWRPKGESHSVTAVVGGLQRVLADGGSVWGAFDERGRMVGIASFRPRLTVTQAQLDLLHVSNGHRRRGIGSMLCKQTEDVARASGAKELYVSATPTGSAVGFYRNRGFKLTDTPDPRLWAQEPEDIHLVKAL